MRLVVRNHAKRRFKERFSKLVNKNEIPEIQLVKMVREGKENKSFLNKTDFCAYLYEKYGYEKSFRFVQNGDVIFIIVRGDKVEFLVTCISASTSQHFVRHKKYKKEEAISDKSSWGCGAIG